MAASGRDYRRPWLALGGPFLFICPNGLRKQFGHVGSLFMAVKHVEQAWYASKKNDADIQNIFLKCNCSYLKASFSNRKVSSVEGFFQRALVLYIPKCSAALFMDRLQLRL